jgi:hypothetical protein
MTDGNEELSAEPVVEMNVQSPESSAPDESVSQSPSVSSISQKRKKRNDVKLNSFRFRNRKYGEEYCKKKIFTTRQPIPEGWKDERGGLKYGKHLLSFLSNKFGGLDKFELVLTDGLPKDYVIKGRRRNQVWINVGAYRTYGYALEHLVNRLEFSRHFHDIQREVANRAPEGFFSAQNSEDLFDTLNTSTFRIIESIVTNFDQLKADERRKIIEILENSGIERRLLEKYDKLPRRSPERMGKLFLKAMSKMPRRKLETILKGLLKSKRTLRVFEGIRQMSTEDQIRIARNLDSLVGFSARIEQVNRSLRKFRVLVQNHRQSKHADEAEIHRFLVKDYWLLSAEYFGEPTKSSISAEGEKTPQATAFYDDKFSPDYEIQRLDGSHDCIVFEFEEANDPVFLKNGKLSKRVMDGINQAISYVAFKRLEGEYSKGIAVIGSVKNPKKAQLKQLRILGSAVNVEVLTYEDIINRAQRVVNFFQNREPGIVS